MCLQKEAVGIITSESDRSFELSIYKGNFEISWPSCTGSPAEKGASVSRINYIPRSKWPKGIPPVMGAHLMPSGEVAPVSTSKGE